MDGMIRIPSRQQCEQLWEEYATPVHIRRHMQQVAAVAGALSSALIRSGRCVMIDLVDRAALLHDLVRITECETIDFSHFTVRPTAYELAVWQRQRRQFSSNIPHAHVVANLLEPSYPDIARTIAKHSFSSVHDLESIEQKIIYYADRRVAHDVIVSIHERTIEAARRYPAHAKNVERQQRLITAVEFLEKELFFGLDITPDDLQNTNAYANQSQFSTNTGTE